MGDQSLFRVEGLVAVITGAGSGLGRMMAHALASNEAQKVYIIGRREDKLKQTADGYSNIVPIQADVTDKDTLKAAADRIKSEVGFINVLMVNSGDFGPHAVDLPLQGTIASIAGYARALSTGAAYIPSKAGAIQLTKMFSTLLARWNIRANAIAPGIYPSEMTENFIGRPKLLDTIPAQRAGSEEDMRGAVLFLTSRAGAYINGDVLLTDGGRLGQMPASF